MEGDLENARDYGANIAAGFVRGRRVDRRDWSDGPGDCRRDRRIQFRPKLDAYSRVDASPPWVDFRTGLRHQRSALVAANDSDGSLHAGDRANVCRKVIVGVLQKPVSVRRWIEWM